MNWSTNDYFYLVITDFEFFCEFYLTFFLKGKVIDNLEEVLELLDPSELRSCAKSINGVNHSKLTSKKALLEAILNHAKSCRSIQNYFSTKNSSVAETILLQ